MAIQRHTAEATIKSRMVGGIKFGSDTGLLVAGDLTSATAAKAAVDVDNTKAHVSEKLFGPRVKASIDQIDNYFASGSSGSSITNILAEEPTAQGCALLF